MKQTIRKIIIITFICICVLASGVWICLMLGNAAADLLLRAEETAVTTIPEETTTETTETQTLPTETEPEPEETLPDETEPVKITIDFVPQYFQTDYPDVRYGTGTLANSGCNMTALAMVASYMTDHAYYPDEIADYMADFIGNNHERLEFGADRLQIPWKRAGNVHDALNAVREGKVVISLMNEKSLFTTNHHFIVWCGVNDIGKVMVLDPNERNYSTSLLADSFENGFPDGYLIAGYEAAWIFDKAEMPEEPFIYEPEPYAAECRYPGLELTEEDYELIAKLICAEGESEPFEGQQAIAEVILNRLYSGRFQNSVRSIIYAEEQFGGASQMYRYEPTYTQYKAVERALYGPYVVPIDVVFFAKFAVNKNVWGTIGAHTFCYSY